MASTYAEDSTVLALVGELLGVVEIEELSGALNVAFHRHVPSDWVSVNEVGTDPTGRVASVIEPPVVGDLFDRYAAHAHENPLLAHYLATGDGRANRFSDVATTAELHATELYRGVYAPLGVNHQMAFILPASPGRVLAMALSRSDHDYTDSERALVNRARPYLIQIWRNALAFRDARAGAAPSLHALRERGLTARQAQVITLVARGRSDRDVAASLGITERTVQKHLERAYRLLGVSSRSEAAALVWTPGAEPPQLAGSVRPASPRAHHEREGSARNC